MRHQKTVENIKSLSKIEGHAIDIDANFRTIDTIETESQDDENNMSINNLKCSK